MEQRELQKLLNQPYKQENWKTIVKDVFPNVQLLQNPKEFPISNPKIEKFSQLGSVKLNDGKSLALFELLLNDSVNLSRNRVELNNEISKYIDQDSIHGVLSVFEQGNEDYRFTFSAKSTDYDDNEGDFVTKKTDTKRYTYVLGKNESCRTAAERFHQLSLKKMEAKIDDIQHAFSVEQLSKEFFTKYTAQFNKFWKYIKNTPELANVFPHTDKEKQEIKIRDFTKKLLGRIVFLHFLQKKGWMGCSANSENWINGDKQFMQNLFNDYKNKEKYHSECLHQLFYNTLNAKREGHIFKVTNLDGKLNQTKVPYLNGGLFDSDNATSKKIDFPQEFFENLFNFFGEYNFTIDENDPNEQEVGIDPEMLGHIFENLLEDNKDKGAFYTPKAIVQYMCQESLIEYLKTSLNLTEDDKDKTKAIELLIRDDLAENISNFDLVAPISQALYDVKICDPAIGSGAFPMGILNEIYQAIESLHFIQPDVVAPIWKISEKEWQPHLVKKNIIQHSIYGVDIESGAVDVARLRFWLALIVDETEPLPLPNLDYKIMQGNSLLESFEGIDLSQISNAEAYESEYENTQIDIFTGEAKKSVKISLKFEDIEALMEQYFNESDPNKKKEIHDKIDKQVINHIRYTLSEYRNNITPIINKLKKDIRYKEANASTYQQKEKIRTTSKDAKELAKLNKQLTELDNKEIALGKLSTSNERPFFLWHLFFKDVFEKGGFDIVIANPPYVEFKNLKKEDKVLLEPLYSCLKGKYDLYIAFMELYMALLKKGGITTSIHPTRFMQRDYGIEIRKFLSHNSQLVSILDFVDKQIFENAIAYTGIFILQKKEITIQKFPYRRALSNKLIKSIDELRFNNHSNIFENINIKSTTLDKDLWIFQSPILNTIFSKVKNGSTPLKNIVDGIYQGIATGKDSVFILEKDKKEILNIEALHLKPFLKGKDIGPYNISFKNKYLIYTYDNEGKAISENNLKKLSPNLYKYLGNKRLELKGRGYFEKSNKYWFELWNQRNPKRFEQLKIITLDNAKRNSFALDNSNYFGSTTVYNLIKENGSIDFYVELLLILNSSLLNFYHSKNTIPQAGGYLRYQAIFIKDLPIKFGIPKHIIKNYKTFNYKVPDKKFLLKVNTIIYKLYDLNYDEILVVEPEFLDRMSKEEYEAFTIE